MLDPDGHCIKLYYYMEQVGWDGKPRPKELRRKVDQQKWPETVEPLPDTYEGEPFFGQDLIDLLLWRLKGKGLTKRQP